MDIRRLWSTSLLIAVAPGYVLNVCPFCMTLYLTRKTTITIDGDISIKLVRGFTGSAGFYFTKFPSSV
jgi:hypothetical protein